MLTSQSHSVYGFLYKLLKNFEVLNQPLCVSPNYSILLGDYLYSLLCILIPKVNSSSNKKLEFKLKLLF